VTPELVDVDGRDLLHGDMLVVTATPATRNWKIHQQRC